VTAFSAESSAALEGPAWVKARRAAAVARFVDAELPTGEQEIWRYTPIKDLDLSSYELADATATSTAGSSTFADAVTERAGLVVIVDGRLASVELAEAVAATGVTIAVAESERRMLAVPDPDALTDLHDAFVGDVVVVTVPNGVAVPDPIVVVQVASAGGAASFPHLVVDAGEQSEVTVLDLWSSSGEGRAFVSPVTEVHAGQAANVRYVGVQDFGPDVWSTGHLLLSPGRDATTNAWVAALGGKFARLYFDAQLEGQAGSADVAGVYFGEDDQVHDFRSLQDHKATRTKSDFLLKGAVVDDSHAVYTGMIRVHEGAKATESFLANRNLVLSDGAHVDSVPNLEIVNENDIKSCGHAAATGPVDEEHVFYLESRGVPTDVAQRLIVFGFFDDVIAGVPVPEVRDPLRAAISKKLEHVDGVGGAGDSDA
jgi:Fe-S cluster assembly protein SufD